MIAALAWMLLFPASGWGRTNEEILADAQAAFRRGVDDKYRLLQARKEFSLATDGYLELHVRGVRTPALYRNLGDAALLADRWSEAIWAYHMGLSLDPNDRAVREHLAVARRKVLYPAAGRGRPGADAWPSWLPRPTARGLMLVFLLSYLTTWIAAARALITRERRFVLATMGAVFFTFAAGSTAYVVSKQADADRTNPVVVVTDKTPFYRGNAASYEQHPSVPILPRGIEARVVHRRGAWLQVRLSTGEVGWLPRTHVLIVEP